MSAVSGFAELDRVFRELSKGMANRIARPALGKAGRLAVKKVKATIPSRYKEIRKSIKSRSIKTKYNGGFAGNKVGAGVSRKRQATTSKKRDGRKGVGIDARNVHWWFLGTDERQTGTKRKRVGGKRGKRGWRGTLARVDTGKQKRRTGRMPAQGVPISVVISHSKNEIDQIFRTWIAVGVKKETERLSKKRL